MGGMRLNTKEVLVLLSPFVHGYPTLLAQAEELLRARDRIGHDVLIVDDARLEGTRGPASRG